MWASAVVAVDLTSIQPIHCFTELTNPAQVWGTLLKYALHRFPATRRHVLEIPQDRGTAIQCICQKGGVPEITGPNIDQK